MSGATIGGSAWERGWTAPSLRRLLLVALVVGVVARAGYAWVTPAPARAHDFPAHLGYVAFVLNHWTVPDWRGEPGFDRPPLYHEFYQPPLYYFLAATVVRLSGLQDSLARAVEALRILSALLSIAGLAAGLEIGRRLLAGGTTPGPWIAYSFLVALFPAVIIDVSGRLTNDALTHALALVLLARLLAFSERPGARRAAGLGLLLGAGLLTKASFILFGAWGAAVILLTPGTPERRARWAALFLGVALVTGGWLYALRVYGQDQVRLVAAADFPEVRDWNKANMTVENTPRAFLTFNPAALVRHPFNDPWRDGARRQYFLEFLFRSALFGEHDFGAGARPLARALVVLALLAVPVALAGAVRSMRRRSRADLALLSLCALSFAALVSHRLELPWVSNQDFRFLSWTCVPLCYWLATGAWWSRWRLVAVPVVGALAASWLAFFAQVILYRPA